jgi:23S rRNA (cytidine1920-2'-O)/16S rRNA (cytidine1409-2'-O)-methyltransferase
MSKLRLDVLMVERGLVESRALAQRLVMAGQVRVADQVALKPSDKVDVDSPITLEAGPKFVSRGGEKLEAALEAFGRQVIQGWVCVDVGASTGGFTDCLLQHGASRVYAVDVGYGILHWKLRRDPRVTVMERTNARVINEFPEKIRLVTVDASFISLKILLPVIQGWLKKFKSEVPYPEVIALIKPQFEAGREDAAKGEGVIRDAAIHQRVVQEVVEAARSNGFGIQGVIRSPLIGPKGNIEFLVHLILGAPDLYNQMIGDPRISEA